MLKLQDEDKLKLHPEYNLDSPGSDNPHKKNEMLPFLHKCNVNVIYIYIDIYVISLVSLIGLFS